MNSYGKIFYWKNSCVKPRQCIKKQKHDFAHQCQDSESYGLTDSLNGYEFEETQGDDDGQRSLACCISWGCKESDMTQ